MLDTPFKGVAWINPLDLVYGLKVKHTPVAWK
jgi:hypothetical protein